MYIRKANYEIDFEAEDINILAFAIMHDLSDDIDRHWNQLQQDEDGESLFFEMRKRNIELMKFLFGLIGKYNHAKEYIQNFKEKFEQKRKEREAIIKEET